MKQGPICEKADVQSWVHSFSPRKAEKSSIISPRSNNLFLASPGLVTVDARLANSSDCGNCSVGRVIETHRTHRESWWVYEFKNHGGSR